MALKFERIAWLCGSLRAINLLLSLPHGLFYCLILLRMIMNLLTVQEAAIYLFGEKGKVGTLNQWRYMKRGPAYRKLGKLVRYSKDDLDDYLNSQRRTGTTQSGKQSY